ncbi:MAG: aminopeptidase P family protein [Acidobacteria bacterium]|nr:aminopeptidase P family protein [Acidobacteriota bacterium]
MNLQQQRIAAIQEALQLAKLDGWLFYDFRHSDPLAYRILKLDPHTHTTRRWFYFVPANGEPTKIVHRIEDDKLDALPGTKQIYLKWQVQHDFLRTALGKARRIAMQYSPLNAIPYISRVDAGTIELVRSFDVEVVTSADLVQHFEAVWSPEQKATHLTAAENVHRIIHEAFAEIARSIRASEEVTEYSIQQFMMQRFADAGMICDAPPIVAVNANSANAHYSPNSQRFSPIQQGDFVLLDVWAKLNQTHSVYADLSWTGFVGETVPEAHTRIFDIVAAARDAAVDFIRQKVSAGESFRGAEVDDVSRAVIIQAGYEDQFTNRTGHSIGEEVHGNGANIDNLETPDTRFVVPNTCFSIEPGIYLKGQFGLRSEIDVFVSENEVLIAGQPIQTHIIPILA